MIAIALHSRPPAPSDEVQALLDAAVDGVVLIDHQGHIHAFNRSAEQMFGWRAAELLGRNVGLLMTEPDRSAHDDHLARYLQTRVPHIIGEGREVNALRKDGSVFPAFLSVGIVTGAEPPRFVGFVQDLTLRRQSEEDRHRLQERLMHVSRLATVGEMSSGIAHELNQPLTAIASYAQACDRLLSLPNPDTDEVRNALKQIAAQAMRSGDIIRRLRSLARDHEPTRERCDINQLVSELTDLVQADARAYDVQYRLELLDGGAYVEADGTRLQQVILNLVRNSLEALSGYATSRREITVRTTVAADHQAEIRVCDTGPGVDPPTIPRLFAPFHSTKPSGTGLGLAISRTILASHGGTLDYHPNSPSGACFLARIPLVQKDPSG